MLCDHCYSFFIKYNGLIPLLDLKMVPLYYFYTKRILVQVICGGSRPYTLFMRLKINSYNLIPQFVAMDHGQGIIMPLYHALNLKRVQYMFNRKTYSFIWDMQCYKALHMVHEPSKKKLGSNLQCLALNHGLDPNSHP